MNKPEPVHFRNWLIRCLEPFCPDVAEFVYVGQHGEDADHAARIEGWRENEDGTWSCAWCAERPHEPLDPRPFTERVAEAQVGRSARTPGTGGGG